jgi:Ca2+-binding EF-hand superfamily protein
VQSKDVSALVKALDKNGDGTVDTQELVQVLKVLVVLGVLGPAGAQPAPRQSMNANYVTP